MSGAGQTEARQRARQKLSDERSDWTPAEDAIVHAWAQQEAVRQAQIDAGTAPPRGRGPDGKLKKIKGARLEEMLRDGGYDRSRKAGQERWKRLQARDRDGVTGRTRDNWSPDEDAALREEGTRVLQDFIISDPAFWERVSVQLAQRPNPVERLPGECRGRWYRLP